mmetsp:Transcript_24530/g.70414  ORF Transcript_24530/g.70414 Transcript_24530/m.70414 type:complete len:754 (+) Transcript_24530:59-2320(+)
MQREAHPPLWMKCPKGHPLVLTKVPCIRIRRCALCRCEIPRATTRVRCKWCAYHVCYECSMELTCRTEQCRAHRQGSMRTVFRSSVDQKHRSREVKVAISKHYDIAVPTTGVVRVHCHSRKGFAVSEDCRFAAFSSAPMDLGRGPCRKATSDNASTFPSVPAEAQALAGLIVQRGMELVDVVGTEVSAGVDGIDKKWNPKVAGRAEGESVLSWMLGGGDLLAKISELCRAMEVILQSQPVVSEVPTPAKVFGDVHGQLRDMLLLFHFFGRPGQDAVAAPAPATLAPPALFGRSWSQPTGSSGDMVCRTSTSWGFRRSGSLGDPIGRAPSSPAAGPVFMSYVFNGDWVDRGQHQLEVVVLLFALKVLHPGLIWLNRGNHEDPGQNRKTTAKGCLGFDRACELRLGEDNGPQAFDAFHQVFAWLPLAARIGQRILVLHGGLGTGSWTLGDLNSVRRPLFSKDLTATLHGAVYNMLWSDPLELDSKHPMKNYGVHPSHRTKHSTVMKQFGRDVTERFCMREGLGLVIRSHQFRQSGKGYELQHDGWLMRVFSARNYCGMASNDGGLLLIGKIEGAKGTLLVRPQNVERMPRCSLRQGGAALAEEMPEPYCHRGHLMQAIEPQPKRGWLSLSRMCGDLETNIECNRCGAEQLQVGRYYNCRGCSQYDLCLACAAVASGAVAEPPDDPDSSDVSEDGEVCPAADEEEEEVLTSTEPLSGAAAACGELRDDLPPLGPCLLTSHACERDEKCRLGLDVSV